MSRSTTTRTPVRRAALALLGAGALAAAVAASNPAGLAAHAEGATPASTQSAALLDNLLHPDDVYDLRVTSPVSSRVGAGNGPYALSACTGERSFVSVIGNDSDAYWGEFSGQDAAAHHHVTVDQHLGGLPTLKRAKTGYELINKALARCEDEPDGHFHYGPAHTVSVGDRTATWRAGFDGDGTRDGGVLVGLSGRHLSIAEVGGTTVASYVRELAVDTLQRMG